VNTRIPPRSSSASWLTMGKQVARFIAYPALLLLVLALVFGLEPSSNALPDDEPQRGKAQAPARPQKKSPTVAVAPPPAVVATELEPLARELKNSESAAAYSQLADFARAHASDEQGTRAALALGYYGFNKKRYAAAAGWLEKAEKDTVLREYVLFWRAQVNRAQGRNAEALAQLDSLRREFPESVITEQAVEALAQTALALRQPERAALALDAYSKTVGKPSLLLLRAQAREKSKQLLAAAEDYLAVYVKFPLSDEARAAGPKIPRLTRVLGEAFPGVPVSQQMSRAAAFFDARKWREARSESERLLPKVGGRDRELVQLRIARCRVQRGAGPKTLASLKLTDPELDAERLYALSQEERSRKHEDKMLAAIEQAVERAPRSRWAEEALFAAGNYFWILLDRARAASYYERLVARFPAGRNVISAHWRLTWVAYLDQRAEAGSLFEEHLRRFPGSLYTENALYWLGRVAERTGNPSLARSYYLKSVGRFPQTYFGAQSATRLQAIGTEPTEPAELLALLSAPSPLPSLDAPIPPAAADRWARALALRSIAFDASAELELRAAYSATGSPRLLWEAARSALDTGRYGPAMLAVRQVFPQLEARKFEDVPVEVWRIVYPLPYESSLRAHADRHEVDPMLVAGLIRQESIFQADAVSRAGAIGLMQVLPKTGKKLARREKIKYNRKKLYEPEYNLRLGTLYLADLVRTLGSYESALAAYNAGEDRVALWKGERNYEEAAQFVESIPFTETREYVQIVLRNADVYRRIYDGQPARASGREGGRK